MITIGTIIDKSVEHYIRHYRSFAPLVGILILASLPVSLAKSAVFENGSISAVILLIGTIISFGIDTAVIPAIIANLQASANNKSLSTKEALAIGKKRFLATLGVHAIIIIGFIVCYIPFILGITGTISASFLTEVPSWVSSISIFLLIVGGLFALAYTIWARTVFGFSYFFVALEKEGSMTACKSAVRMVKNRFWAILLRMIVSSLVIGLVFFIIAAAVIFVLFLFGIIISSIAPSLTNIYTTLATMIRGCIPYLALPLFLLIQYYLYEDLRHSNE